MCGHTRCSPTNRDESHLARRRHDSTIDAGIPWRPNPLTAARPQMNGAEPIDFRLSVRCSLSRRRTVRCIRSLMPPESECGILTLAAMSWDALLILEDCRLGDINIGKDPIKLLAISILQIL